MMLEMLLSGISPLPYMEKFKFTEAHTEFDGEFIIEYDINDVILSFAFAKVYLLVRYVMVGTRFMNPRAQRVCS